MSSALTGNCGDCTPVILGNFRNLDVDDLEAINISCRTLSIDGEPFSNVLANVSEAIPGPPAKTTFSGYLIADHLKATTLIESPGMIVNELGATHLLGVSAQIDTVTAPTLHSTTFDTATLTTTGNATIGGSLNSGAIVASGTLTAPSATFSGNISAYQVAGTITTATQNSITKIGTQTSIACSGNITQSAGTAALKDVTATSIVASGDISQTTGTATLNATTVESLATSGNIVQSAPGISMLQNTTATGLGLSGDLTQSSGTSTLKDTTVDSLTTAGNITQTAPGITTLRDTSVASLTVLGTTTFNALAANSISTAGDITQTAPGITTLRDTSVTSLTVSGTTTFNTLAANSISTAGDITQTGTGTTTLKGTTVDSLSTVGNITQTGSGTTTLGPTTVVGDLIASKSGAASNALAFGASAGLTSQGNAAIALGHFAGYSTQGASAVAVGAYAGQTSQHANSIILNATGGAVNSDGTLRFYVAPVRDLTTTTTTLLCYNPTTKEIGYGATLPSISTSGNITQSAGTSTLKAVTVTALGASSNINQTGGTATFKATTVDSLTTAGNITQSAGTTSLKATSVTTLTGVGNASITGTLAVTGNITATTGITGAFLPLFANSFLSTGREITGIPSTAKRISIQFTNLKITSTVAWASGPLLQLGSDTSYPTNVYLGSTWGNNAASAEGWLSNGIVLYNGKNASSQWDTALIVSGDINIIPANITNKYIVNGVIVRSDQTYVCSVIGQVDMTNTYGPITKVRFGNATNYDTTMVGNYIKVSYVV